MKGLEPSTFCMAISSRRGRFGPIWLWSTLGDTFRRIEMYLSVTQNRLGPDPG